MTWPDGSDLNRLCLAGGERAVHDYDAWSGGLPVGRAPESFLQAEMARELSTEYPFVTLETRVQEVLDLGKPNGAAPVTGRIDIVLWTSRGLPRILIEVKKARSVRAVSADIFRLRQLAQCCKTIRRGVLAVFCTGQSSAAAQRSLTDISEQTGCRLLAHTKSGLEAANAVGRYWTLGLINVRPQ